MRTVEKLRSTRERDCSASRSLRNACGVVFVEAVVVLPVIFLIVFATVEFLRYSYLSLTTQYVASSIARASSVKTTGRSVSSVKSEIISKARRFGVTLGMGDIKLCAVGNQATALSFNCAVESAGQAEDSMTVQIRYSMTVLVPFLSSMVNELPIRGLAFIRHEPK